ncbi:MAG: pseudaminic acid synthase [Candidatus Omnitrophica bacterium]|nr:pseudaminic acid synthase [Candidatus Omnitrophota bacterium]
MGQHVQLDNQFVGFENPCYIIAEIGSNHNRDFDTARALIDVAKESGCNAVKFQSYTADGLYSKFTPRISEMEDRSHPGETPYELIKRVQMPVDWHQPLSEYCQKAGITFCSTPFDESMVDILEGVNIPFYKVSSYDITFYPMLVKIARTGKPVILSTGNSDMKDIEAAVDILKDNGCVELVLLHCVSQYPAVYEDMNLKCIETLRNKFDCLVGLSDHTMDSLCGIMAVSLGVSIIEKHITLDRKTFGPDHPFALEPDQLKEYVAAVRNAETILGDGVKSVCSSEQENHKIGRRSIIAAENIKKGEEFTREKLVIKRPAMGIHPRDLNEVIGKRAKKDILKDYWITQDCF